MFNDPSNDLFQLAWQSEHRGDLRKAAYWYQEASNESSKMGRVDHTLLCLSNVAEMYVRLGEFQKAIEVATQLLSHSRNLQLDAFEMRATGRLVEALLGVDPRSRWSEVKPLIDDGLEIAKKLSINYWIVYLNILSANGRIHVLDLEAAYQHLQTANNNLLPTTDDRKHIQASILSSFALLMFKKKQYADARLYAEQAVGVARDGGVLDFVARTELVLAQIELSRNEKIEALNIVENVRTQAIKFEWTSIHQTSEFLCAEIRKQLGHTDEANKSAQKAIELARLMQAKERLIESIIIWGGILSTQGKKQEALTVYQEAKSIAEEMKYVDHATTLSQLLLNLDR